MNKDTIPNFVHDSKPLPSSTLDCTPSKRGVPPDGPSCSPVYDASNDHEKLTNISFNSPSHYPPTLHPDGSTSEVPTSQATESSYNHMYSNGNKTHFPEDIQSVSQVTFHEEAAMPHNGGKLIVLTILYDILIIYIYFQSFKFSREVFRTSI